MVLGGPRPTFSDKSANYFGFVNGDSKSSLGNLSSLTFTSGDTSTAGTTTIALTGSLTEPDYTIVYDPGTLTVVDTTSSSQIIRVPKGTSPRRINKS